MKRILVFIIICLSLCCFAACGTAAERQTPGDLPVTAESSSSETILAQEPKPEEASPTDAAESEALDSVSPTDFIDLDISSLKAVFGEPVRFSYSSSCLGSGKDGMLEYESFDVYTYLDEKGETIQDVVMRK